MSKGLQTLNNQNKLTEWAGRVADCRNSGLTVKTWCKENGICEQTYYKWQKRLYEMALEQQEVRFAEVTPMQPMRSGTPAITVRIGSAEAEISNGADAATIEAVLRVLKLC